MNQTLLFLDSLGGGELLLIMVFILLFFGSKKIPDLARGLGRGMREFKDAMVVFSVTLSKALRKLNTTKRKTKTS